MDIPSAIVSVAHFLFTNYLALRQMPWWKVRLSWCLWHIIICQLPGLVTDALMDITRVMVSVTHLNFCQITRT